ncbi:zinc ribbon domain-containing protein [Evansella tamaricis]|uniref:Zinc ribbon domain-containing protein n=1 Tax=Evansella tamaricis TaxID=2069301 RepID=A0ABS6JGM2_9BACI|nr:zinc ribbon domain-containing protein [Evansella tamaricis]MBU9712751.1 zinc ribbon domain-containing protein [Evansella tamaricis]
MFCSSCGNKLEEGAKFCGACGTSVAAPAAGLSDQSAATSEVQPQQSSQQTAQDAVKNLKDNEYVQQGKEISKMYYQFALASLKAPFRFASNTNEPSAINGLISIILFSLLVPFTTYLTLRNPYYAVPFGSTVVTPAIVLFVTFMIMTGVMFVVLKLMKVDADFKLVLTRLGSLIVFPLLFVLAGFVFTLLSVKVFGNIVSGVGLMILPLTTFATIFSFEKKQEGGLDPLYGIIIMVIALFIISLITFSIVFERLVNELNPFGGYLF